MRGTTYICSLCSVDYSGYEAYIEHLRDDSGRLRFTECNATRAGETS